MSDDATQEVVVEDKTGTVEVDWKERSRMWESRSKANKARVEELEAQLASVNDARSENEKLVERVSQLEEQAKQLEHSKLVAEVAKAKNIDSQLLTGATLQELEECADRLIAWRDSTPAKPRANAPLVGTTAGDPPNSPYKTLVDIFKKGL